ncbi:uncharacterized protein LOC125044573 [Penaeus chinensis]|uniref:uncharacterized protein LOC125044573 n=1 Tax=Penaeus chinensis TaxID=139456 RepID=UPI001FB6FDAA|nr:uncharacterized protein LOC125044573 [Penaeus chinensis]
MNTIEKVDFAHVATEMGGITIKNLVTKDKFIDNDNKIKILTIGRENSSATKTILLIGETGSGKTTLLNAMINYLMGVQFEDNFRYSVKDEIGDDRQKKVTDSQTEFVTGYHIYYKPGMVHDYNYLIIDSPGLLDTRGKKIQDKIRKQAEFFLRKEELNITELHSLAFVINGTTNRYQQCVKDVITDFENLFGKDTDQITNILATHCDNMQSVQQVLKDVEIKYSKLYNFQNDCIFSKGQGMLDSPWLAQVAPLKWECLMKKYQEFFEDLNVTTPVSLLLSREAAVEKKELEGAVIQIKNNIEHKINTVIEYESQRKLYEEYKTCMKNNKTFEGTETVSVKEKASIEGTFTHAHNCKKCNRTCVFPCYTGGIIVLCLTFYGKCEVCQCSLWDDHEREGKRIVEKLKTRSVTHKEMKKRYEDAMRRFNDTEAVKTELKKQIDEASVEVAKMTQKITDHINVINRIIRNPKPKTPTEYFNDILKGIEETMTPKLTNSTDKAFLSQTLEDLRIK